MLTQSQNPKQYQTTEGHLKQVLFSSNPSLIKDKEGWRRKQLSQEDKEYQKYIFFCQNENWMLSSKPKPVQPMCCTTRCFSHARVFMEYYHRWISVLIWQKLQPLENIITRASYAFAETCLPECLRITDVPFSTDAENSSTEPVAETGTAAPLGEEPVGNSSSRFSSSYDLLFYWKDDHLSIKE